MRDITITEGFAIISLNTQDSRHKTVAKKAALRCIAAARLLDSYFLGELDLDTLIQQLPAAAKLSLRLQKELESEIRTQLFSSGYMEEVPALLGCDFLYYSAAVTMKEYRAESEVFLRITESLKADILEDGDASEETICYLWLLRESGCIYDIFSFSEQEAILPKMNALMTTDPLAGKLFPLPVHKTAEQYSKAYLQFKRKLFHEPFLQGVNLVFPFLERRQSIFIDTEAYCENAMERLTDVLKRVETMGHHSQVIRTSDTAIVKIDNLYYELFPYAMTGQIPVHGVKLIQCIPS